MILDPYSFIVIGEKLIRHQINLIRAGNHSLTRSTRVTCVSLNSRRKGLLGPVSRVIKKKKVHQG